MKTIVTASIVRFGLLAICLTLLQSGNLDAQPLLKLSWDTCDGPQNRNFEGPGSYTIVASMIGATQPTNGQVIEVRAGPGIPDLWKFQNEACLATPDILSSNVSRSCRLLFVGLVGQGWSANSPDGTLRLIASSNYSDFQTPDPDERYALFKFGFNFFDGVEACPEASEALCFRVADSIYSTESGGGTPFLPERDYVTWNDPDQELGCPGATQATSLSWGRVKSQYR